MIEFALLLVMGAIPVFLFVDFGNALRQKQIITDAARQGARTAAAVYQMRMQNPGDFPNGPAEMDPSNVQNWTCDEIFAAYPQGGARPAFVDAASKWSSCSYLSNSGQRLDAWQAVPTFRQGSVAASPQDPIFAMDVVEMNVRSNGSTCLLCVGPSRLLEPAALAVFVMG